MNLSKNSWDEFVKNNSIEKPAPLNAPKKRVFTYSKNDNDQSQDQIDDNNHSQVNKSQIIQSD